MPYRKEIFATEEYYHIFNRGNNKDVICKNKQDYARLLFVFLHFQSPLSIRNIGRHTKEFEKTGTFGVDADLINHIIFKREVALVNFSILQNHFHLTLLELKENGISRYMHRTQNSFAKYFNAKYKKEHVGHVFQGSFGAVHQENNEQILYLSSYIHRNIRDINEWKNSEKSYPWSSFQDYIGTNRWGGLLQPEIILEQFKSPSEYKSFVDSSPAKENIKLP
ncbi:MAG: hypothetical protein EXS59_00940 [Candidatus Taylorbacteria bacterium]|nr:hypothetical protein [Candidatus Taylorbacteria bacterium]